MSAGGGVSQSNTKTRDIPKWALPFFQQTVIPTGQAALDQYNAGGGAGGQLRDEAGNLLSQEVTGAMVDPSHNPAQQEVDANARAQAAQSFDDAMGKIRGGAEGAGALYSSGVPAAEADAAQKLATGVADVTSQADQNWVGQQAGLQARAATQASGFNQQALNDYLQMLNALRGISSSSGTSGFSANITI